MKKNLSFITLLILIVISFVSLRAAELTADEIITNHIQSIGKTEKRQSISNLMAIGSSEFIVKVPYSKILGKALLASDAKNLMFLSSFPMNDYPFEKIGFFGEKVNIPFVRAGFRSPLGNYLLLNDRILSQGLFAGSITPSWHFVSPIVNKEKIEFVGKKKIGGVEMYVVNFIPKKSLTADSSIKLFFDTKTFRHLRTEYLQKIGVKEIHSIGVFNAQPGDNTNILTEEFGDFKETEGLTLPYSYSIKLLVDSQVQTNEFQWNFIISQYRFNQKLDASFFSFDK